MIYETFERYKITKASKWWLFKARVFGKRIHKFECIDNYCTETKAVFYKGVMYIHKKRHYLKGNRNGKTK